MDYENCYELKIPLQYRGNINNIYGIDNNKNMKEISQKYKTDIK